MSEGLGTLRERDGELILAKDTKGHGDQSPVRYGHSLKAQNAG